jgi:transposase
VAVFGLLKRKGKVYTAVIPNANTAPLLPIIKEQVRPDSIVYTDIFGAYNALDVAAFHHVHINHFARFADQGNHLNGIMPRWL